MDDIKKLLMQRLNCSENESEILYEDLSKIDCALLPIFNNWILDADYTDATKYDGYSIASLCQEYNMNFVAALLTVDWLIKEPQKALKALKNGIM